MNRRKFIALVGGVAAWSASDRPWAQQQRPFRLGVLNPTFVEYAWAQSALNWLSEFDIRQGRDFSIEARWAAGRDEQLPELASELVRLKVDLIVTQGARAIRAAKQATSVIPIVMIADGDPVADGLVQSLARPGGNLTGIALPAAELLRKRLELLKEFVPALTRVGLLFNPDDAEREAEFMAMAPAAEQFALSSQILPVRGVQDFEPALALARNSGCGAVMVLPDRTIAVNIAQVQDLAVAVGMPMIYPNRWYVEGSHQGLMSYGPIPIEVGRRAASFVHRILVGAKPADLPIEQPPIFELVINLNAARAIGSSVPESLLARADRVIE